VWQGQPLCYCYKKWELRLHGAGVAGTATKHCHAYAIFLFLDLVILNERARGEVRYPRWHWMSFRDIAGSEWHAMVLVAKRVSCRDKCISSSLLVLAVCCHALEARSLFERVSNLVYSNGGTWFAPLNRLFANDAHPCNRAPFNTSPQRNTAGADAGDLFGTYELS
jgi:hypothetical protein